MNLDELMPASSQPPPKPRAVPAGPGPIKTCPGCGVQFQKPQCKWCSDRCKEDARARDPKRIENVRQRNQARYRLANPDAETQPLRYKPPAYSGALPGVSAALSFDPGMVIKPHHRQLLHGLLTSLVGDDHEPLNPAWRLFPVDQGCGWGVHVYDPKKAERLFAQEWPGRIGKHVRKLRFAGRAVAKPPKVKRGRYRLTVTAITPVCVRSDQEYRQQPTAGNFVSALRDRVSRQLGLSIPEELIYVRLLDTRTEPRAERLSEKLGTIRGWVGDVDLEVNAVAAWLLMSAARCTGLGSKTAYGFGTIRISGMVRP